MENIYKIVWTKEANGNLDQIISYLEKEWTNKEIKSFFVKLEKAIALLSARPLLFRATNKRKQIHRCLLTRQVSIYYKIVNETIVILSIFDNRQNPSKQQH